MKPIFTVSSVIAAFVLAIELTAHADRAILCQAEKDLPQGGTFEYSARLIPGNKPLLEVAIYPKGAELDHYAELYEIVEQNNDPDSGALTLHGILPQEAKSVTLTVSGSADHLAGTLEIVKPSPSRLFAPMMTNQFELKCN